MIKIGMMIGDRYEILEKIGTGGMSDVYKAKCHKLNRFVAVKILKQEFSENANFVSKFRIEAQAAAGLMHPNIVNVYDVGEENGIYYIVMELVEGITLKKYIEKKARLSFKEAVSIAIHVSMGIEAAHNNHIIHRDIKPQNIIISREGKVKVTDFGIAKAATSNTITSNVMGSVHYTSPEQARGGYSDEKSDVYSLGVTLFEMLTGRVPFNGETTVAIAIKHIQEEMPSPKDFVPEIPSSVESIVLKCCQKSADRRYQSMQELIADLKQSLMNPDEDFVVQNDPDVEGGTRMITDSDRAQIKRRAAHQEAREYAVSAENVEREEGLRLRSEAEHYYEEEDSDPDEEDDEEYDYNPRMERFTTLLAILVGVVIVGIVVFVAARVLRGMNNDEDPGSPFVSEGTDSGSGEQTAAVPMPDVKGKMVEDARNTLAGLGIKSQVEYQESDSIDAGVVISANVAVGDEIPAGSTVTLIASAGTRGLEVPGVTGISYEDAESRLETMGFSVTRAETWSDTVEEGVVVSQMPDAGNRVPSGTNITVTVSKGPEEQKKRVPNLMGHTEMDGRVEIVEAGLEVGSVSYVFNTEYEEGLICYQSYSQGSYVEEGTLIDIKVSKGAQAHTYMYNAYIEGPTVEEAPDYVGGTDVRIKLTTDDGTVLLETTTSSFPQAANYHGMTSSGGTITMTYIVTSEPVIDEAGNTIPGETQEKTFSRRVEFTVEG